MTLRKLARLFLLFATVLAGRPAAWGLDLPLPAARTQLTPADGTVFVYTSADSTFKWEMGAKDAVSCDLSEVEIQRAADGVVVHQGTGEPCSHRPDSSLFAHAQAYRWRVRLHNATGWGDWSVYASFVTSDGSGPTHVPASRTTLTPTGGQVFLFNSIKSSLSWELGLVDAVNCDQAAVELSRDADGTVVYAGPATQLGLHVPASGLLVHGTAYRWRVRLHNAVGWSDWSSDASFVASDGSGPTAPPAVRAGLAPTHGDMFVFTALKPSFTWELGLVDALFCDQAEVELVRDDDGTTVYAGPSNQLGQHLPGSGLLVHGTAYRWRVRLHNAMGWSPWSDHAAFLASDGSGPASVPAQRTQLAPSGGTAFVFNGIMPCFTWELGVIDALHCDQAEVELLKDADGSVLYAGPATGLGRHVPGAGFVHGSVYRWRVRLHNAMGWGPWSASTLFVASDGSGPMSVPAARTQLAPANGALFVINGIKPAIAWELGIVDGVFCDSAAVEILRDADGAGVYSGAATSTAQHMPGTGQLVHGTAYRWRVRLHNAMGWGSWSAYAAFVASNGSGPASVPAARTQLAPANGAVFVTNGIKPTLVWERGLVDAVFCDSAAVEILRDVDGVAVYSGAATSTAQHMPGTGLLVHGTAYRWRVRLHNTVGWGSWSTYAAFVASNGSGPASVPGAPTGLAPAGGAVFVYTGIKSAFTWNLGAVDAVSCDQAALQVVRTSDGVLVYSGAATGLTNHYPASGQLAHGVAYQWRVRLHNAIGWSTWSAYAAFTASDGSGPTSVPGTPTGLAPAGGSVFVYTGIKPAFTWNLGAVDAVSCDQAAVQVTRTSDGVLVYSGAATGLTSHCPASGLLVHGVAYQWRVRVHNAIGWSAWSAYTAFTASDGSGTVPAAPTGLAPATNAAFLFTSTKSFFSWTLGAAEAVACDTTGVELVRASDGAVIYSGAATGLTSHKPAGSLLTHGTTYRWRVRVHNAIGWSPWSAYATFIASNGSGTV